MSQRTKLQNISFCARLRELMDRDDLTQRQLASAAGISQSAISHYLRGLRTTPGVGELLALAAHFNVSIDWLLGVDSSPLVQPTTAETERREKHDAELERIAATLEDQVAKVRTLISMRSQNRPGRKRAGDISKPSPPIDGRPKKN